MQTSFNGFEVVAGFPRVVGIVDATHVKLQNAGGEKPQNYTNTAGWFSMNVQVSVVGRELKTKRMRVERTRQQHIVPVVCVVQMISRLRLVFLKRGTDYLSRDLTGRLVAVCVAGYV